MFYKIKKLIKKIFNISDNYISKEELVKAKSLLQTMDSLSKKKIKKVSSTIVE